MGPGSDLVGREVIWTPATYTERRAQGRAAQSRAVWTVGRVYGGSAFVEALAGDPPDAIDWRWVPVDRLTVTNE